MSNIRNSAKAIIVQDEKLLLIKNRDQWGDWYILPGGGQRHGETLHDALQRECVEEIGTTVTIGELRLIREYISRNHEFADDNHDLHQIELMFECHVEQTYRPTTGHTPDGYQTGVVWLPLNTLEQYRIYPSVLRAILKHGLNGDFPIYLGDVN